MVSVLFLLHKTLKKQFVLYFLLHCDVICAYITERAMAKSNLCKIFYLLYINVPTLAISMHDWFSVCRTAPTSMYNSKSIRIWSKSAYFHITDLFCLLHEMTNPKQKSYDTSENLIYDTSDWILYINLKSRVTILNLTFWNILINDELINPVLINYSCYMSMHGCPCIHDHLLSAN